MLFEKKLRIIHKVTSVACVAWCGVPTQFLTSDCEFIHSKFMACYETTLMAMQEIRHETKLHTPSPMAMKDRKSANVNNQVLAPAFET